MCLSHFLAGNLKRQCQMSSSPRQSPVDEYPTQILLARPSCSLIWLGSCFRPEPSSSNYASSEM